MDCHYFQRLFSQRSLHSIVVRDGLGYLLYLMMQATATELLYAINEYLPKLKTLNEEQSSIKPLPNKWSKKELIGHLIDSAQNNIRRFIVAQYEHNPVITYQQDDWVTINNYQSYSVDDLIQLWYLLNKQICSILNNASEHILQRTCPGRICAYH